MSEEMQAAIAEAFSGVEQRHGGPFGAVVVHGGEVIARGHNQVVTRNDPTAHAEIVAIREACRRLATFDLSDCELYTTCEPCPMCYAAAWWARLGKIHYGCSRRDAAAIGFDDEAIYDDLEGRSERRIAMVQEDRDACLAPMRRWRDRPDRVPY
ncbi:MAG: nucleoside deaminase [bacterium]